jgi:O-methyltransferase involved in polyketide biosynthesis
VDQPVVPLAQFTTASPTLGSVVTVANTAFSIAVVRAEDGDRPGGVRLFVDPYARLFAAAGANAAKATQRFLDLPLFRDGVRLRTRLIDEAVRDGGWAYCG